MPSLTHRKRNPKVEARRAAKRRELLDAAISAIEREGPRVSMREMAAEANVTKPILYRHFGAKGGLYQAIAERYATELLDRIRDALARGVPSRDLLTATLNTYLAFLKRKTQVHRFLVERALAERPGSGQAFLLGFRERIAVELERELRNRLTPLGPGEATVWAHALVGMAESAGEWWLDQDGMSREEIVEQLVTLLWDGLSGIAEAEAPVGLRRTKASFRAPAARTRTKRSTYEEARL
jgi:AcrR family transcriptional regulator